MRAARVQAKRKKEDPRSASSLAKSSESADTSRNMPSKLQVGASRVTIDSSKSNAETTMSEIFVDRQQSESIRRRKEATARDQRYERLERELKESQVINAELESRWDSVAEKTIPQELYSAISGQYKEASALLNSKDELIKFLQVQLRHGDEEYVELLSQHQEDINAILKRLSSNFSTFLATIRQEITTIEETFIKERAELLEKNREEIDALFDKRRKLELVIMESKQQREKKFAAELLEIRSRDAEDYNSLKVDLENSIQIFEQQLEEMRATYQLNSEKLEYNHSVLIERDLENKATVEHHRQRLRRLKESLSALIARFHKQDAKFKSENSSLTDEYKRATEAFKDLQKKYAHFVTVDTRRYAEVWTMNERHVMQLVHKVLKADQIIHAQILGVEWMNPVAKAAAQATAIEGINEQQQRAGGGNTSPFQTQMQVKNASASNLADITSITSTHIFMAGQQQAAALEVQQAQQAAVAAAAASSSFSSSISNNTQGSPMKPSSAATAAAVAAATAAASAAAAASSAPPTGSRFTPAQIKSVLDLLAHEVSFLLDSRIQETVLAVNDKNGTNSGFSLDGRRETNPLERDEEADMYIADGIMAAIGVEDREDLDSLVSVFYEGQQIGGTEGNNQNNNSGSNGINNVGSSTLASDAKPSVHPNDVAKIIKEFVLKRQQVKTKGTNGSGGGSNNNGASILAGLITQAAGSNNSSGSSSSSGSVGKHDSVLAEKKSRRLDRERLFWNRLGHVISERTLGVWGALERWQHQYNILLEERATLIDETTELAKQNEELKILLQQYLSSKVNQELEIPPTRLIRVNNQR